MKLTRMIFDKWKIWMRVPVKTNLWSLEGDEERMRNLFWHYLNYGNTNTYYD